ncbi:M949_RS01915 family surface polysaccharide biosynthesis protein [uncultured Mucilaginibacter sp.]|uniref:M949_RS01915 family surface polysaccharide biosynthesis protein n=1 Tax=uncultured Mucilaginibacter sp. TaxID=797541 RepID=UPI0025DAFEF3|nr:hypothetical protein [uncultured Mucilaginibacter sp.]
MRLKYFFVTVAASLFLQTSRAQMFVKNILHDKIPVSYTGKAIDAYEYRDKAGLHIYLVTKIKQDKPINKVSIFGFAYTSINGVFVKDWEIKDFSDDDVLLYYEHTIIVDVDKDGIYETFFVYELDPNMGEGSNWKVMVHYKNIKAVLRAHIPELDSDNYTETMDKSFDTMPVPIKKIAKSVWDGVAKEEHLRGTSLYK